jgi:hypothetical protein
MGWAAPGVHRRRGRPAEATQIGGDAVELLAQLGHERREEQRARDVAVHQD